MVGTSRQRRAYFLVGSPASAGRSRWNVGGAGRTEVRPFTPAQVKLLETFADQAIIAIENVRLFKELQERNRDLTEALEQQTATSEILRLSPVRRPTFNPCWMFVAENAARLMPAASDALVVSCGLVTAFKW